MNIEEIFQQVMNENCKDPLHRFAELVRQDEREAIANSESVITNLSEIIQEIKAKEREACAKLCDEAFDYFDGDTGSLPYAAFHCSKAIRRRTE